MSENQNGRIHDRSKYNTMTTEELEQILRLDMDAPEGQESDTEILLDVMEVLANRNRNTSHTENTAQRAYESFKKNYLPEVEEKVNAPEKKIRKPVGWLRGLAAAAAVLVIVLLGSATAQAFCHDILEAVIQWTQETFHFGDGAGIEDGPMTDGDLEYTSLQEVLASAGIEEPPIPTWVPNGYQLTDITVQETPLRDVYTAQYLHNESELIVTLRNYLTSCPQYVEQSDDLIEIYEFSGTTYYLFSNHERTQAAWINGSFECYILGDLSIEELKLMIASIEKG